jgi:hypothetical protein
MTLREIITAITDGLDRPNDIQLYNRIRIFVLSEAANLLRQQANKYGLGKLYTISKIVPLEKYLTGVKTINKIPTPLRVNDNVLFTYVGSKDGKVPYRYATLQENIFAEDLDNIGCSITYEYEDNYIYVRNTTQLKELRFSGQFNITYISDNYSDKDGTTDDSIFPFPDDLVNILIDTIISSPKLSITDNRDKIEASHLDNE